MAAQCRQCGRNYPTGEQGGHCTGCHLSFSSDRVFDRHRVGSDTRRCLTEPEMLDKGFRLRDNGYWGTGNVYDKSIHSGATSS